MPDTRVPVFGYWACPSSFTDSVSLQTDNGEGELPPSSIPKTTLTQNFRSPSRLSCNVKASDG